MTIKLLFKLWVASLCAVFACALPQSLSKAHEIGIGPVRSYKPVSGLLMPKLVSMTELSPVDVPVPVQAPSSVSSVVNCGSNLYMAYIYQKESGCNTGAINEIGCRGLGQSCPSSKLTCGNDWACQDAWFRQYAVSAYGSIYNAYLFRTAHNWW